MFVDVIVCTRNRPSLIAKCLSALLANHYPKAAVLVVDQSSDTATSDLVKRLAQQDGRLRYIHQDGAGLSRARNLGIKSTAGDIVAFTDDDCEPQSGWVAAMVDEFASHTDIAGVYGRSLPCGQVAGRRAVAVKAEGKRQIFKGRHNPWSVGHGNNMAFRREVFATVGLFDELMGPGAALRNCDDADFTYRALRRGLTLMYSPDPIIYHDQFRDEQELWRLEKDYNLGAGAVYSKWLRIGDPYAVYMALDRWMRAGMLHVGYGVATMRKTHVKLGLYRMAYSLYGTAAASRFAVDRSRALFIGGGANG